MPEAQIVASRENPIGDFFGNVFESLGTGLERIGGEILPNWVEQQLKEQTEDQLQRTLFDWWGAPRRVDQPVQGFAGIPGYEKVLFDIGTFQVTGGTLMIAGAIFIIALIVFKKRS